MNQYATKLDANDLIAIAEREVIEKALAWKRSFGGEFMHQIGEAEEELLAAITLLESREAMMNTEHLEPLEAK